MKNSEAVQLWILAVQRMIGAMQASLGVLKDLKRGKPITAKHFVAVCNELKAAEAQLQALAGNHPLDDLVDGRL